MTVQIIEDFNGLSNGNLNGQNGWSGSTNFQVESSTVLQGTRSVSISGATANYSIQKTVALPSSGKFVFGWLQRQDNANNAGLFVELRDSSGYLLYVQRNLGFGTYRYGMRGVSDGSIGTATNGVTQTIELEIDMGANTVRGRVDGGSWVSMGSPSAALSQITLVLPTRDSSNQSITAYIDYFYYDTGGNADRMMQFFL